MKQVGLRQEAARLGGVGSCGRELCCSTWLTDLRKVNTTAARYQQLSLNPQKLAGQCGKLKCCLNYELDTYVDALKEFPKQEVVLRTEKGDAVFVKMDIFKGLLWYTYKENRAKWYKLSLEQVKEIISANKNKEVVSGLEDFESEIVEVVKKELDVVGQDSLTRFDTPKARNKKKNKNKNKNQKVQNTSSNTQNNKQLNQGQPKRAKQNQELKNQQPERKKPVHKKPFSNKQKPNAIEGKKENIPPKGNLQSNEKSSLNQQKQLENKPKNKNRNKKRRQPKKGPNPSENA